MRGVLTIAVLWVSSTVAAVAGEAPLFGFWLTENADAIVRIQPCAPDHAPRACGRIVWLSMPLDALGRVKTDFRNPDPERHDDPLCSVELIRAFELQDDGAWTGGKIYNPRDGQSYPAEMALDENGALRLRGYLLLPVFGMSQTWTRVADDRGGCDLTGAQEPGEN